MSESPENDEFEEILIPITITEADRIISALNDLMKETSSPSVVAILEDACCDIASLIPDDEEEEPTSAAA